MTDITLEQSPAPANVGIRLSVAELKRRAALLLPELRQGAEERERHRILPHEPIRRIGAERLLTWRVPQTQGGSGASVRDVIQFVIDVASVDSNVAQALRPSFLFLEGLLASDDEAARQRWLPHYLNGELFGNAGWEVGGANGAISVQVKRGTFKYGNSSAGDLIAQADVGADCYIVDDQTVAKTNGSSTRSVAGKIIAVDADGVWVKIGQ